MVTQTAQTSDPMQSAMDADYQAGPRTYFGQISADVYYCVLVKGEGKVPFDPNQHGQDMRRTAVDLLLQPLPRAGGQAYTIERSMVAESREWAKIVKESLRAIGTDLRAIKDKWVQVQLVSTGSTYTNRAGETKERTTFRFVAIYPDQDACQQAADAFYGQFRSAEAPAPVTNGNGHSNGSTVDPERATAAKFLPALWKQAGNNVQRFEELIRNTPPVNRHFDLSSPEVLDLIQPF